MKEKAQIIEMLEKETATVQFKLLTRLAFNGLDGILEAEIAAKELVRKMPVIGRFTARSEMYESRLVGRISPPVDTLASAIQTLLNGTSSGVITLRANSKKNQIFLNVPKSFKLE